MIVTVTLNVAIDKRYVVDQFKFGEVMRVKECRYSAGGKGLNVSRVATIAGEEILATGFIGGHAGDYVVEELEQQGIRSRFVKVPGESRSCINLFDIATSRQTELLEPGVLVEQPYIDRLLSEYREMIGSCSVVSISGSVPRGVGTDVYPQLIQEAHRQGKPVILDTSGALLKAGIEAKPTMVKPNQDEIQALLGISIENRDQLIEAACRLHEGGIRYVVVSLGRDGALIVCDEGVFRGITPDIPVVNTVGCGDSMVAAFAVSMARGYGTEQMIKTAMAISTANALREETGFYVAEDFDRLMTQVGVERLR